MTINKALLPAVLHSIALSLALCVQTTTSIAAGMWLPFHLAGCFLLLYRYEYTEPRSAVRRAAAKWLITIALAAFVIRPIVNGAYYMWVFTSMPALALCLTIEALPVYATAFGAVITVYAAGLVTQYLTGVNLSPVPYDGRYAWPLLDPNNAACVINAALVTSLWLAITKDLRYSVLHLLFLAALVATGSKAGLIAAGLATCITLAYWYGAGVCLMLLVFGMANAVLAFYFRPEAIVALTHAFADRLPIWWAGWTILAEHPLRGTGIGSFSDFYVQQGATLYIPPTFAHNDLLQFAVEMGVPATLIFIWLLATIALSTRPANLVSALVMLVITLQAMVEFQFYLPAIGMIFGLALSHHMLHRVINR